MSETHGSVGKRRKVKGEGTSNFRAEKDMPGNYEIVIIKRHFTATAAAKSLKSDDIMKRQLLE
jgi:hypothetical protein